MDNRPIGVFDSGVGGLTVAKEIIAEMPNESIIYIGDSKRAPYGVKTKEEIVSHAIEVAKTLEDLNVKAMVVACNTICVAGIDELREIFPVPIIDVIEPGVEEVVKNAKKSVAVMATPATIKSGAHAKGIREERNDLEIHEIPCALLCPIVEEGFGETPVAYAAATEYLKTIPDYEKDIDTIILACTHYPLMKSEIQKAAGKDVNIVDPSYGTALKLKEVLEASDLLAASENVPEYRFYSTGEKVKFDLILGRVFENQFSTEIIKLNA